MDRRHWIIGSCALLLVLGGCAGLLGDDGDVDPGSVSERVDQRLESIETLRFTLVQTVEHGNETETFRMRVVYERPDRANITYLEGPVPYAYSASNGTATWRYNESTNEVAVAEDPLFEDPTEVIFGADQLSGNATFEGNETLSGEDATELAFAVADSEVSLLLAGGQETSQLGQATGNGSVQTRVWIDNDLWLPRKVKLSIPALNESQTVTVRYEDIEINPEIDDDQFTFDPPADATTVRGDHSAFRPPRENTTFYDDRERMAAESPLALPDPSVPAGYEFTEGAVIETDKRVGAELTYSDGDAMLEISTLSEYPHPFFDQGEEVAIGDVTGLFVELPGSNIVQWECDDRLFLVAGEDDRETVLSVAESMGCS